MIVSEPWEDSWQCDHPVDLKTGDGHCLACCWCEECQYDRADYEALYDGYANGRD